MELDQILRKVKSTRNYENLTGLLGKELGKLIYQLVEKSDEADKELDIVHECLSELYNQDSNVEIIKNTLDEIYKINKPNGIYQYNT